MKALTLVALGGGAFLIGKYLLSLKHAEQKVVVTTTAKRDKITAQGINISVRYNIKNPTAGFMRMSAPLIKFIVDGKLLASSSMKLIDIPEPVRDKEGRIYIRPFSETGEIETKVLIPWLGLASVAPAFIDRLQSTDPKDKVKITVETVSQVFMPVGSFPYFEAMHFAL
jgi:hypothetical protein